MPTSTRRAGGARRVALAHGDLPGHVYDEIQRAIIRGRLAPGERVTEADIAQRLGISRTPVREALTRLHHEGYLVGDHTSRRTQLTVAPLTRADVEELWGLMAVLEGCAALAAGRLPKPRRDAVADALDAINDEYAGAVHDHPRDPDQLSDLQTRFHQTLVDAGAGPRLQLAHRTLHPHVERYQWAYGNFVRESRFDVSVTEHRGIVRRLRRGDAESLRSAVEEHWRRAARRAASLLNGE